MSAASADLRPLVDHHCHGLLLDDLDRLSFEALMNEAAGPSRLGTSFFDSMLGLAIRRWCAPVLGLEPHAPAEDYLARRRELGVEASRLLVAAAGIETFLVDTGLPDDRLCSPAQLAALSGGRGYEVIRLEALAEELINTGTKAADFAETLQNALQESTPVAAKSIAAYRVGLDLAAERPQADALTAALASLRPVAADHYRIAHPVISCWLAWTAIELGIPLQIHVGYGDSRHRLAPRRSAAAHSLPASDRAPRCAGAAVAQLSVPPPSRVSGAGLQPCVHRSWSGGPQHRRTQPDTDSGVLGAGSFRQAAVLHRRVRARRALPPRCRAVPARPVSRPR